MVASTHPLSIQTPFLLKPACLELLISLAILPLLVSLLGQQQLFSGFLTVGSWCEGIFQGIALPFLEISE